ncbi:MAG: Outer membrane protein TolC precursor [Syntrophaceae bacterium PtaU1.Bin231]|nr:MAG: Outer membrane protein TolC precursor [Syntrophaceae bacterium PtaU1.Bin231]
MKHTGRLWRRSAGILCGILPWILMISAPAGAADTYSLEDLYRLALKKAEVIKVSEENVFVAEMGQEKAYSFLLPRATAFGGAIRYTEDKYNTAGSLVQPLTAASWGVRVDETLSLSGRELTALGIAKDTVERSRRDLSAVKEIYLLAVAASYFDVFRSRRNLEIADANLERLGRYREAAEKRLKVGEVTKTVLLRAEGELSGAQSDRLRAANAASLAQANLARIVGIPQGFELREEPYVEDELRPLAYYRETAEKERSDLKSLEIQKKISEDQVLFTKGSYWPSLSLSAVYAGADQDPASSTINRESVYGAALLNFPFFEGGLRKAEVKEAMARERQTRYFYEDLRKAIGIEVESAYLEVATQKGQIRFLQDQLTYARDNYNAVSRQFEFGLSSSIDVIDANTLLVSAEQRLAEALYSYQTSVLSLKKATGVLLRSVTGLPG